MRIPFNAAIGSSVDFCSHEKTAFYRRSGARKQSSPLFGLAKAARIMIPSGSGNPRDFLGQVLFLLEVNQPLRLLFWAPAAPPMH